MNILLPIIIFLAWLAALVVPAGQLAIEDAKRGVPKDKRRGTSIMPLFPTIPLAMWGAAWLLNRRFPIWGSQIMLWLHVAILLLALVFIIRDILKLRTIERGNAEPGH
ncbi:MAG: hypothetical protein WC708_12160 [Lentisphaeria bacterium]